MKYFGYMPNDFINGEGVCVSLWTAGCNHHCEGCHNKDMWNEDNGFEIPTNIKGQLVKAISANGITRNFSILGGEPLTNNNKHFVSEIIKTIRIAYPNIKIFLWTGYTLEELLMKREEKDKDIDDILHNINVLIDGKYIQSQRDITLPLRGSTNQRILYHGVDFE